MDMEVRMSTRTPLLVSAALACLLPAALHAQEGDSAHRRDTTRTDCPMGVVEETHPTTERMPVVTPGTRDSSAPAPMPTVRPKCRNDAVPPRSRRDSSPDTTPR